MTASHEASSVRLTDSEKPPAGCAGHGAELPAAPLSLWLQQPHFYQWEHPQLGDVGLPGWALSSAPLPQHQDGSSVSAAQRGSLMVAVGLCATSRAPFISEAEPPCLTSGCRKLVCWFVGALYRGRGAAQSRAVAAGSG